MLLLLISSLEPLIFDFFTLLNVEVFFIQLQVVYLLFLFMYSKNLFYSLTYLLLLMIFFGIMIGLNQYELFTGFLWVLELTMVFMSMMLIFYLNMNLNTKKLSFSDKMSYPQVYFYFLLLFMPQFFSFSLLLNNLNLEIFSYWIDFYSSMFNQNNNDFTLMFFSFYIFNSLEFISIGLLLFFGSLTCVLLNVETKGLFTLETSKVLNKFKLLNNFFDFNFLSKQNLMDQSNFKPSLKIYKKK